VRLSTEKKREEELKEIEKQNKKNIRLKETAEFLRKIIPKPSKTPEEVCFFRRPLDLLSLCLSVS
jgi:hypothetical protein